MFTRLLIKKIHIINFLRSSIGRFDFNAFFLVDIFFLIFS